MSEQKAPIELYFKSAKAGDTGARAIKTFTSYNFERSVLTPAASFRFTAPGVDKSLRKAVRSGDLVQIMVVRDDGQRVPIGTGFIDETDTHVTATSVEYVLTGRDTLSQLVDNAAVDAANKIIVIQGLTLVGIVAQMIKNTRMPQGIVNQGAPGGTLLLQTHGGETKISALQRYLEFKNCLVWSAPDGRIVVGRPNFTQERSGYLVCRPGLNSSNVIEARAKRNVNQAIRQIVTQLQTLDLVDAGSFTTVNSDPDVRALSSARVGKSVYSHFSYADGADVVNQLSSVGQGGSGPRQLGQAYSLREIARENMKILDVELVVRGHTNASGAVYNVDQVYNVQIEADDVYQDMYVYQVGYEMTVEHGMLTRLHLCKLGTIVAEADALRRRS